MPDPIPVSAVADVSRYRSKDQACPGCGKPGRWYQILGFCCSRACMLQAEYAKSLHD